MPNLPKPEIFYVHNPAEGVLIPPNPEQMFAVVRVKGIQYKVVKDDRVMMEKLPFDVGQQVELEDVLMVGTKDYTCIGRPTVTQAKILATVEEQSQTEKTLIFKKRRRKDSQRHRGYRHEVTVLKIDSILHSVDEKALAEGTQAEILNKKMTVDILAEAGQTS